MIKNIFINWIYVELGLTPEFLIILGAGLIYLVLVASGIVLVWFVLENILWIIEIYRERRERMRIYYYGCNKESGHFLWQPNQITTKRKKDSGLPWEHIDGCLCPQTTSQQGVAKIHHKEGWTAIGFWDKSVDSRTGSNSVFFYEDLLDFDQMIEAFKEEFPSIYKRFKFQITQFYPPEED